MLPDSFAEVLAKTLKQMRGFGPLLCGSWCGHVWIFVWFSYIYIFASRPPFVLSLSTRLSPSTHSLCLLPSLSLSVPSLTLSFFFLGSFRAAKSHRPHLHGKSGLLYTPLDQGSFSLQSRLPHGASSERSPIQPSSWTSILSKSRAGCPILCPINSQSCAAQIARFFVLLLFGTVGTATFGPCLGSPWWCAHISCIPTMLHVSKSHGWCEPCCEDPTPLPFSDHRGTHFAASRSMQPCRFSKESWPSTVCIQTKWH